MDGRSPDSGRDAIGVAFGADPGAAVRVGAGASPAERWLGAVALGGQGHYAAAAALLQAVLADARAPVTVAAHAAVTLAAHRRQLGGHAAARPLDALGLRLAASVGPADGVGGPAGDSEHDPGLDALAARIDALTGLAADALGTGEPGQARRLLAVAEALARDHPSWRPLARTGWVRAEAALFEAALSGSVRAGEGAVEPAQQALALSIRGGSVRHTIKSRIVVAVADAVSGGDEGRALAELDAAADEAQRLGLLPLVWPARMAAQDLVDRAGVGASDANERHVRTARKSMTILSGDAARRRHAGITTLSVIEGRCDPVGRALMGEWTGVHAGPRVM